jgi:dihydrofolate reductase
MGKVVLDVSVSLDGYTTGPNVSVEQPMGEGGAWLHEWISGDATDREVGAEMHAVAGAAITGRRTFEVGIGLWGEDGAFRMPCFVLTHRAQPPLIKGPTTFHFVTHGIANCLAQARAAAGDKEIWLMGAADTARQFLLAGLVDEVHLHQVAVLLGSGTRLFDQSGVTPDSLEQVRSIQTRLANHLYYRVIK